MSQVFKCRVPDSSFYNTIATCILTITLQIEVVDPSGKIMDNVNDDVTVERLWDDGAPANVTNVPLKNGFATYTIVPSKAHTNSTLNLVVSMSPKFKQIFLIMYDRIIVPTLGFSLRR